MILPSTCLDGKVTVVIVEECGTSAAWKGPRPSPPYCVTD